MVSTPLQARQNWRSLLIKKWSIFQTPVKLIVCLILVVYQAYYWEIEQNLTGIQQQNIWDIISSDWPQFLYAFLM